jgi:hypothetical protein
MRCPALAVAALVCFPASLGAQAPPTADLWLVATSSLATPPALEDGATATLWNPAARMDGRVAFGLSVIQPPDVLGLTGLALAGGYRLAGGVQITALIARIHARDLVRTTTSPTSQPGAIAVYDQLGALGVGFEHSAFRIGAQLRVHDSRFDVIRERGVTMDLGLQVRVLPRMRVAAATHFLPVNLAQTPATDYYAGAEFDVLQPGAQGLVGVTPRYGLTVHADGGADHHGGVGIRIGRPFRFDTMLSREARSGNAVWRPAFALQLRIGPYAIGATRGSGVNDIGATYRVVLDVGF